MPDLYRVVTVEFDLPLDDTEYEFVLPHGARNFEFKMASPSSAWRWSTKASVVATPGEGHPMSAASSMGDDGVAHVKQTMYFAHTVGSSQTMKVAFNVPMVR